MKTLPSPILSFMVTDISEHRRMWLLYIVLMLTVLTMGALVIGAANVGDLVYSGNQLTRGLVIFYSFMYVFFAMLAASLMAFDLKSKEDRLNALMRPGDTLAKFLARALMLTVGFALVFLAAVVIAELLRVLLTLILFPSSHQFSQYLWLNFHEIAGMNTATGLFATICFIFFMQSVYALGSLVWPKLSFIKTSALIAAVQLVISIIMGFAVVEFLKHFTVTQSIEINQTGFEALIGALFLCWGVVQWVIAYKRYKETDIINHWYSRT